MEKSSYILGAPHMSGCERERRREGGGGDIAEIDKDLP